MALPVPSTAGFITVDTSTPKTFQLPLSTEIVGRVLTFKDRSGNAHLNNITIQVQGSDTFQDGSASYKITQPYGSVTLVSRAGQWLVQQGTEQIYASSIVTNFLTVSTLVVPGLSYVTSTNLLSTVSGLGTAGYVSTLSLYSTTQGLQEYVSSFIDPTELASTVTAITSNQLISTFKLDTSLASTVQGLASSDYISTTQLTSTVSGITNEYGIGLSTLSTAILTAPFVYPGQLLYLNYSIPVSTPGYKALQTYPRPLNAGIIVSTILAGNTISTVASFESDFFVPTFIPAGFWENRYFAYATGANVTAFVSLYDRSPLGVESLIKTTSSATTTILTGTSPQENIINMNVPYTPISTGHTIVWKISGSNAAAVPRTLYSYFEDGNTYSYLVTTFGGTAGYDFPAAFSTLALYTTNTSNYFSSQIVSTNLNLLSTVQGLGSSGYVSTLTLTSTVNAAISSLSTAYGIVGSLASIPSTVSTFNVLTSSLTASTIQTNYFSSLAIWVCTINGLPPGTGSGGLANIPSTLSTFAIYTSSLFASTIQSIVLSSQVIYTSSIFTNYLAASTGVVSSFSTNTINFAGGFGYLTMPDIFPNTVYTSTVTASNLLVGWNSVISPIQFFGFGTYLNSVVAELSTGSANQELILFRGSNATDRIRMQTTGSIVFEPGVSARLWPTVPSNVTPAMIINTSSNVGIQVASPTVPLDVGGQIRAVSLSTQQIATSSIINNPRITGAVITSSLSVLGPSTFLVGAFSTSFMTAGTPEIDFYTNNVMRMTILSNGNVGIGTTGPAFLLDVNGNARVNSLFLSSATAYNNVSTVQFQMSSVTGNNVQVNTLSSFAMGASTFTGKWNDAQYYVLQTI